MYFGNSLFARPLPVFVLHGIALYSGLAAACRSSQSLIRFMVIEERKAGQASLKTVYFNTTVHCGNI